MSGPRNLEEKQAEKARLSIAYNRAQRERWKELCTREPRLTPLRRAIRHTQTPAATLLLIAESWVRQADQDLRHAILRQIDRHANRMVRFAGRAPLDDPMPPQMNVFLTARQMLAVR